MIPQEIGAIPPGNEPAAHAGIAQSFLCRLYLSYLHKTIQMCPRKTQPPAAFLLSVFKFQ